MNGLNIQTMRHLQDTDQARDDAQSKAKHERSSKLNITSKKISKRSLTLTKPKAFQRHVWSQPEDDKLIEEVKIHGRNWGLISQNMDRSRSGKQIRDRYLNKLEPSITQEKWSEEEERALLGLFKIYGRRWCEISKCLPGRTEIMVKNRFYSKFRKHLSVAPNKKEELDPTQPTKQMDAKSTIQIFKHANSISFDQTDNAKFIADNLQLVSGQRSFHTGQNEIANLVDNQCFRLHLQISEQNNKSLKECDRN